MSVRICYTVAPTTLSALVSRESDLTSPIHEPIARAAFPEGNPYLALRAEH